MGNVLAAGPWRDTVPVAIVDFARDASRKGITREAVCVSHATRNSHN